ncbi:MAG: DUF2818 family protein [Proteobacteria bacterium]|nr:DUF2818 family protein [Pseudomonadota bacterium]MBS0552723.1 DUF2818 family protein [Pseudomonadota bacterium]
MTGSSGAWLILAAAFFAANLPFVFERVFFVLRVPGGRCKSFGWRLAELVLLYFLVGIASFLFEDRGYGGVYRQGWEFYATTISLFIVFSFPGFVFRYLWRHETSVPRAVKG